MSFWSIECHPPVFKQIDVSNHSIVIINANKINPNYFQIQLDSKNISRLFWTIDYQEEFVTLELRVSRDGQYDWFAIGFSDYGEINQADLCVIWFDNKNKVHFQVKQIVKIPIINYFY